MENFANPEEAAEAKEEKPLPLSEPLVLFLKVLVVDEAVDNADGFKATAGKGLFKDKRSDDDLPSKFDFVGDGEDDLSPGFKPIRTV